MHTYPSSVFPLEDRYVNLLSRALVLAAPSPKRFDILGVFPCTRRATGLTFEMFRWKKCNQEDANVVGKLLVISEINPH